MDCAATFLQQKAYWSAIGRNREAGIVARCPTAAQGGQIDCVFGSMLLKA